MRKIPTNTNKILRKSIVLFKWINNPRQKRQKFDGWFASVRIYVSSRKISIHEDWDYFKESKKLELRTKCKGILGGICSHTRCLIKWQQENIWVLMKLIGFYSKFIVFHYDTSWLISKHGSFNHYDNLTKPLYPLSWSYNSLNHTWNP
jgi:hypothetical protein